MTTHKVMLLEEEAVTKLRKLQQDLYAGSDRERDFGIDSGLSSMEHL